MKNKIKWTRNGLDYEIKINNNLYELSRSYGVWNIWCNNKDIKECYDNLADAKGRVLELENYKQ